VPQHYRAPRRARAAGNGISSLDLVRSHCVIDGAARLLPLSSLLECDRGIGAAVGGANGGTERASGARAWHKDFWARVESYDTKINQFWLILSGLLLIWGVTNAMRVSDVVGSSRGNQSDPRTPTVIDGVPIVITDAAGPATVGLLRSRVLVPRWVLGLPGPQRKYVLRHEDEHRRAHDARLLFVASLPLILMPWNLALWWELRRLCLAVEMDCDNRVVAALGNPNAYGELLLKVAQAANRGPRLQPAFLGMGSLERRLTLLLAPTPLRHAQKFLVPALAFVLLLAVLAIPHPVIPNHQHSAMMAGATTSTSPR
jgi:beta-lactamase regulating signal transducer with metallopeptidase domain